MFRKLQSGQNANIQRNEKKTHRGARDGSGLMDFCKAF